jgi:UDPglucose 6-dehydrogenase
LSSELSKLTANAFGTTSFFHKRNERIQWKTGQMLPRLKRAIGTDIVSIKILKASVGFEDRVFEKILNLVYISKSFGLNEAADYWEQVIIMNDHQKRRFARNIVCTLYNTVADKKIAFLLLLVKKDTNDTRESAAIYVADDLINEQAQIAVLILKYHKYN